MGIRLILASDVGTTAAKTALVSFKDGTAEFLAVSEKPYRLLMPQDGWVEQDPEDWWQAIIEGTRECLSASGISGDAVHAVTFTGQMQGLVAVGTDGRPLRRAISYLDSRAESLKDAGLAHGLLRYQGIRLDWLFESFRITRGIAASGKDPVWKYRWMKQHEPHVFEQLWKWLDVKDYLIFRATRQAVATLDTAHLTWLFDVRPGREGWSETLLRRYQVDPRHLPQVIASTTKAGVLIEEAASQLGIPQGVPVFPGAGDVTATAVGTGSRRARDTHMYLGTSGWLASACESPRVDAARFMAAILGESRRHYYFVGEQETAGSCLAWAQRAWMPDVSAEDFFQNLSADLVGMLPDPQGPLFAPWLQGNRAPASNEHARAILFGLGLGHTRRDMVRAVGEGLAFHQRWIFDAMSRHVDPPSAIQLAGGVSRNPGMAQLIADTLEVAVRVVPFPTYAGVLGASVLAAEGLGVPFDGESITYTTYHPRPAFSRIYRQKYRRFVHLYPAARPLFNGAGAAFD